MRHFYHNVYVLYAKELNSCACVCNNKMEEQNKTIKHYFNIKGHNLKNRPKCEHCDSSSIYVTDKHIACRRCGFKKSLELELWRKFYGGN